MRFLILYFLVILSFNALSQRGVVRYSKEDGLVSNEVNDVAYDRKGFLWLATSNGLDRFDGQRFIHFKNDPYDSLGINSNRILHLIHDKNAYVWGATYNSGVFRIQTTSFRVENFQHSKKKNSLPSNRVNCFAVSRGNEILLNPENKGLSWFVESTSTFSYSKPSDDIKDIPMSLLDNFSIIYPDQFDAELIWCGSYAGLLCYNTKSKTWKRYSCVSKNLLKPFKLSGDENTIKAIQQDGKGNIYLGTAAGGLLYFDKYQGLFRKFENNVNPNQHVLSLKWRDLRYLYVCMKGDDFQLFDTRRKVFIRYEDLEHIVQSPVHVTQFRQQIAIASKTSGFYIQNESLIYGARENSKVHFVDFYYSKTDQKTYRLTDAPTCELQIVTKTGIVEKRIQLPSNQRYIGLSFVKGKGVYIIGTKTLLVLTPLNSITSVWSLNEEEMNKQLSSLISFHNDSKGSLWLGTNTGSLIRFNSANNSAVFIISNSRNTTLVNEQNPIRVPITHYQNTLFFANQNGIGLIDIRSNSYSPVSFTKLLPSDQIRSLTVDKTGRLWIGTMVYGCYVISLKNNSLIKKIDAKAGLQTPQVDQLVEDANGQIWLLNPISIAVLNPSNFGIRSLERRNGMGDISRICSTGDFLFFTESSGFVQANSSTPFPESDPSKPYILRVRELNKSSFIQNKHWFNYNENNLAFEFGVRDFSNSANNLVSYRLKGLDNKWRSGNGQDEVSYYNLPGKNYTFQVRLQEDGKIRIASYSFKMNAPFWQRWWFYVILLIVIFFSIWLYLRIRVNRIKRTEELRTDFNMKINEMEAKALRAQMNPHFLFNSLNSIRLFILKNEIESASDYIAKFSKLLRMILNHSRQDMISVYDEIQSLKLYLEFERLRFDHEFNFDLIIDGQEVLDCKIPPMIIQPFIENAIWHGLMPLTERKGDIKVSFKKTDNALEVTVQDNGIGRDRAKMNNTNKSLKEGSVGLQITKDRLRSLTLRTNRLNDFEIVDLFDENEVSQGTLITLYFETTNKP